MQRLYIIITAIIALCGSAAAQTDTHADSLPTDTTSLSEPADKSVALQVKQYINRVNPGDAAYKTKTGIIIIGSGNKVRAVEAFGGSRKAIAEYARVASDYKRHFGDKVNVYLTVIPSAAEFYMPDKALSWSNRQAPIFNHMINSADEGVIPVDIYTPLGLHADQPIYSRTDHHWAPLGAYYAAEAFAKTAGVPFEDLSSYQRHSIKGYVGSMYAFSKDIAVKKAPEEFVYYTPTGVDYTTYYTEYKVGKNHNIISSSPERTGKFFHHYKDGSGAAYCTFMGGDTKITRIATDTHNGRRLIIFKDSYGNAIPGYLFHSFEEIHVIDFRYFDRSISRYVAQHGITDILFANNILLACSGRPAKAYRKFLAR